MFSWNSLAFLMIQQGYWGNGHIFNRFPIFFYICFFLSPFSTRIVFLKINAHLIFLEVGNLISGSSAFYKTSLNIWKFMIHVLLKTGFKNVEHYFTSMWDKCDCVVVWAFFGIAFLCDWNENWPFPILWPLLSFPNLLAYWVQHFHSIIF